MQNKTIIISRQDMDIHGIVVFSSKPTNNDSGTVNIHHMETGNIYPVLNKTKILMDQKYTLLQLSDITRVFIADYDSSKPNEIKKLFVEVRGVLLPVCVFSSCDLAKVEKEKSAWKKIKRFFSNEK